MWLTKELTERQPGPGGDSWLTRVCRQRMPVHTTLSHTDKGLCLATRPNRLYLLFYIRTFLVTHTYAP